MAAADQREHVGAPLTLGDHLDGLGVVLTGQTFGKLEVVVGDGQVDGADEGRVQVVQVLDEAALVHLFSS